ncbi:MAG: sugar phosphate isomerase/epimerase [Planctomycetota bacterium]|nr:MAG: sugar phosphate isomerase/epimerase [Planctomycetota bacterium]
MVTRRAVLGTLAASGAGLSLAGIGPWARAIDPFDRPKPGRLKLSLAAYSMRKYLTPQNGQPPEMDLFDFVDFCADHGLTGAELTSYYFPDQVTPEYLFRLKRHCHLRGITVSGGAIRNDFCAADREKVEQDLQHTRTWVRHYAMLGAPVIRIFAGKEVPGEELDVTLARCAKNCMRACRDAARQGMMLALENHGGVTATADGLLGIVHQVDSPAFGVNFDSGNFRATDDPYAELARIAPYAINAQIKVEIHRHGKTEETDLERVLDILREAGYSGWVALEYEAAEEPRIAIPRWLERLKSLV